MLSHLDGRRRQVEHLPPLHPGDRRPGQPGPALPAADRLVHPLMTRFRYLGQGPALMTVLPARLAAALLPQRLRRRLAQAVRRRRLAGVPRRLRQPLLKLSNPLPRPGQLIQRHSQIPAQRHHQRGEHLTAAAIMIAGHTRTLREVYPLPPAIRIGWRVGATAERHTALHIPDQLLCHYRTLSLSCHCSPRESSTRQNVLKHSQGNQSGPVLICGVSVLVPGL